MGYQELDDERLKIPPYLLVEVAGTPFKSKDDIPDIAGDVLRAWGIDNPRPRIVVTLGYLAFGNVMGNPQSLDYTTPKITRMVNDLVSSRTPEMAQLLFERDLRESEKYLSQFEDEEERRDTHEVFSTMMPKTPWEDLEVFKKNDPIQQRVDFISGGVFDAITLTEVLRRRGEISDKGAGLITGNLLEVAPKEDLVIVTLINPKAIQESETKVPLLNPTGRSSNLRLRFNQLYNESAVSIAQTFSRSFPKIETIDLQTASSDFKTELQITGLCALTNLSALSPYFPELSENFGSLLTKRL